jgi:hypothetical protein
MLSIAPAGLVRPRNSEVNVPLSLPTPLSVSPRAERGIIDSESQLPLLSPASAWRVLCHRTGIPVSRATFYRWLGNGKVFSMRMGQKIYIPVPVIEEIVKHYRAGERF